MSNPSVPPPPLAVLLVGEAGPARDSLARHLRQLGLAVDTVDEVAAVGERFEAGRHQLVFTGLRLPSGDWPEVLQSVRRRSTDTPVVVVAAFASLPTAVSAMRAGAWDFVGRPIEPEQLDVVVHRALEHARLLEENRRLRAPAEPACELLGRSSALVRLAEAVDRVAAGDAAVLLLGEPGTGKRLTARRLHARSRRAAGPLVVVSCAGTPPELLEGELFGAGRGAAGAGPSGAAGCFVAADGGTLVLDEVGELPLPAQTRLLRVLEEPPVVRRAGVGPTGADVRVVATTSRELGERVDRGEFRADLYYRLNVVELRLPPLRERLEDVEPLARCFVARAAAGRPLELPEEVLEALRRRRWPGNVAELERACERAALVCRGDRLGLEDLPPAGPGAVIDWPDLPPGGFALADLEATVLRRALELYGGDLARTAACLRLPRPVLVERLRRLGLDPTRHR
ncbi:MAG: sigma-54-dependent Fis family transcriptional regulator [Deltaproteobacteria bacterium]|nr:sigma-54-dependent Fis family transcriptional regulator [Deltaproteobacteria bacterium]